MTRQSRKCVNRQITIQNTKGNITRSNWPVRRRIGQSREIGQFDLTDHMLYEGPKDAIVQAGSYWWELG
jgi:hypothetical protein